MVQTSSSVNEIRRDLSNSAANEDLSDDGVDVINFPFNTKSSVK